jgi:hypothetical protein
MSIAAPTPQAIVIGDVIAGIETAIEPLQVAPARDQRVIPGVAIENLTIAAPTLQAIGTVSAIEALSVAPARDQGIIPGFAKESLTNAGPPLQAVIIVTGIKVLQVAPARDQRVIPSLAIKLYLYSDGIRNLTIPAAQQAIVTVAGIEIEGLARDQRVIATQPKKHTTVTGPKKKIISVVTISG